MTQSRTRVLLLWHCLTGYWAAAIRALSEQADVSVIAPPPDPLAPYDYSALDLGSAELQVEEVPLQYSLLEEVIERTQPDLVCGGGHSPAQLRALHRARREHGAVSVMFTDYFWTGSSRQRVTKLVFPFIRRYGYDIAFVPGARSAEYARRMGFPPAEVLTGGLTIDHARFAGAAAGSAARWEEPSFLYVGRLVPEKAPDVLAESYRRYRNDVVAPWPLHVVGSGPFDGGLRGATGVSVTDFLQPSELPGVLGAAGALVLPSHFDPWGVVALEACAAGLPVVISDGCGAAPDLVSSANGFTVTAGDPDSLAEALAAVSGAGTDQRRLWGRNSAEVALGFTPEHWAESLLSACR